MPSKTPWFLLVRVQSGQRLATSPAPTPNPKNEGTKIILFRGFLKNESGSSLPNKYLQGLEYRIFLIL